MFTMVPLIGVVSSVLFLVSFSLMMDGAAYGASLGVAMSGGGEGRLMSVGV